MLVTIWITLFVVGSIQTGLVLHRRLPAVLGALAGILVWLVCAFGALNLEVASGGAIIYGEAFEPLSFLALAGVVINLVYLFADATDQLPDGTTGPRGELR